MTTQSTNRLVWVDLEMTGLDPERCVIVEIATIVTDDELNVVELGPNLVIHASEEQLAQMDPVVVAMHERSGLTARVRASTMTLADAEAETLAFLARHVAPRTAPLAGNSVWKDRQFLERHMPRVAGHLHYRLIDVSTLKELARRWYPSTVTAPHKKERHRALDDIHESIEELRHYAKSLFVPRASTPK
ncbi:MAG: oligoribonuclease [Polyangiaceae bacterium]